MEMDANQRVLGVGIDLVEVSRLEEAVQRHGERFLNRIFTEEEQRYCNSKAHAAQFYAARFAAKEAVAKAFGTGIGAELGWLDIEVRHNAAGGPEVRLQGKGTDLARARGVREVLISLTHTPSTAAASVILQ